MSASVIPGDTAEETISSTLRKLLRPLESHGLTTSTPPTFSIRTKRLDSHVCRKAPSLAIPQPIGDRQLRPSIVPPWKTVYLCIPSLISSTCNLATSVECVSVVRGYHASSAMTGLGGWGASARDTETTNRINTHARVFIIFALLLYFHKQCSYTLNYDILREWSSHFNSLGGRGRMKAVRIPFLPTRNVN